MSRGVSGSNTEKDERMPKNNFKSASKLWSAIPKLCKEGLEGWPARDFCALECYANDPKYAKPDSQKTSILWRAKNTEDIKIETITGFEAKHPWVSQLFISDEFVRFPYNLWDSLTGPSLCWDTIKYDLVDPDITQNLIPLPRWSTASRSCLALIPEDLKALKTEAYDNFEKPDRVRLSSDEQCRLNLPEWNDSDHNRFCRIIPDIGQATTSSGIKHEALADTKHRLYSVKTGVTYVGSINEGKNGKDYLEANCSMAMLRSEVIEAMPNKDLSFGVQTEVLTITAPLIEKDKNGHPKRDGFQVRDLSCLWPGTSYLPCQAIPYARKAFDRAQQAEDQCRIWKNNFAIPLGRAKARLFLNYGLIHTSANAQNFLLGFKGYELMQFVARDVGDTSWHDDYLTRYLSESPTDVARHAYYAFKSENNAAIKHVLHETSSGDYPPPHIVRLAANSVLTHGFGATLMEQSHWSPAQLYDFTTGILDGFIAFIKDVLEVDELHTPKDASLTAAQIKKLGTEGKYPTAKEFLTKYESLMESLLTESSDALFSKAAYVRSQGKVIMETPTSSTLAADPNTKISILINAEEALLCAGLEKRLGIAPETTSSFSLCQRLDSLTKTGNWPPIVE